MIGLLRGVATAVDADRVLVDVNGVGYLVTCANPAALTGDDAVVHVHTVVREDALDLYGFASQQDRDVFATLLGIRGIGAKTALPALATLGATGIAAAAQTGDVKALSTVPGIGTKTAERVLLEMRGKFDTVQVTTGDDTSDPKAAVRAGAIDALESLGWPRSQAHLAVAAIPADHADLMAAADRPDPESAAISVYVRLGLRSLSTAGAR